MANNLIGRININTTNTFTAGDVLKVYWDDVALGIIVHKNDVLITSGGDVLASNISIINLGFTFCDGTTLNVLNIYNSSDTVSLPFPYAYNKLTPNSTACGVVAACDIFLQLDSIVRPTTTTSTDGEINVTATTSRASVEYSLQDFNIGEGQSSGSFTGLSQAKYTVYARDTNNCLATYVVNLTKTPEYSPLYRAEWYDIQGNINRFDIEELDYAGSVAEVNCDGSPLIYSISSASSSLNFYEDSVKPSSCTLRLISETNFKYTNLFTQNDRKYRGIWYINISGGGLNELWRGFLIPSVFGESYTYTPYVTTFTFTDGLEDLNSITFIDRDINGFFDNGTDPIIKIIANILKETGLFLPIRCGINVFSDGMAVAATTDPFNLAELDSNTFDRNEDPFTNAKVLTEILKDFGAMIYQYEGYWYITRPEETRSGGWDYREFTFGGVYSSNSTYSSNVINIDEATVSNRLVLSGGSQTLNILPAYGSISMVNQLNVSNLIKNGDFKDIIDFTNIGGGVFFYYWIFKPEESNTSNIQGELDGNSFAGFYNGNAISSDSRRSYYETAKTNIVVSSSDSISFSFEHSYDKLESILPFIVKQFMVKFTISGTDYYLKEDGSWSTTEYIARFTPNLKNNFNKDTIQAELPEGLTGKIASTFQVRIYNYYGKFGDYLFNDNFTAITTDEKPIGYKMDVRGTTSGRTYHRFYELSADDTDLGVADTVDGVNKIIPDDYAEGDAGDLNIPYNKKVWKLVEEIRVPGISDVGIPPMPYNNFYYIDNVSLTLLPNGQEPPTKETLILNINENYRENLDVDLTFADVGQYQDGSRVINDVYTYDDYYRLSDGSPILDWQREGQTESSTIQKILLKTLGNQFSSPTKKLQINATTDEGASGTLYIKPFNILNETFDSDTKYFINSMSFNSKMCDYSMDLIELKEITVNGGASIFNGDFSADFGDSFDTIFN